MRSAAALLVEGDSPTVRLVGQVAEHLGLPRAAPGERSALPVVALVGSTTRDPDDLWTGPPAPGVVLAEPTADGASWFTPAAGHPPAGAALLAAWSPLVTRAGRAIATAGALRHVEVRVRRPQGGSTADALALAAWSLSGRELATIAAGGAGAATLRGDGVDASIDAGAADVPEWSLQAASDDCVIRLELAPSVALERNGEPVATGDDPDEDPALRAARHLGVLGFLDDLRAGTLLDARRWPPGAHPAWGVAVERLLVGLRVSSAGGGAPTPIP